MRFFKQSKCIIQPKQCSQEFHYYPFAVKLDGCVRSCNTLNNLSNKVCIPDKQWNNDKCRCECKKRYIFVKEHVWNPAIYNCEKGKYLASIMDDSVITYDNDIQSYDKEIKIIFIIICT